MAAVKMAARKQLEEPARRWAAPNPGRVTLGGGVPDCRKKTTTTDTLPPSPPYYLISHGLELAGERFFHLGALNI